MAIVIKAELGRVHLGKVRWVGNIDGDPPTIELNIRMLGIDTPELHYPGNTRPRTYDARLRKLLQTHGQHFSPGLREHLTPKLEGKPGSAQEAWRRRPGRSLASWPKHT